MTALLNLHDQFAKLTQLNYYRSTDGTTEKMILSYIFLLFALLMFDIVY